MTYRIRVLNPSGFVEVDGKRIEIVPWLHTFIHSSGDKSDRVYVITEARTGDSVSFSFKKKDAVTRAKETLEHIGESKTLGVVEAKVKARGEEAFVPQEPIDK